jgi:hypothetical protein
MYDLLDIQTLFSTDKTIKVVKTLLSNLRISYNDHTTLLELDNCVITFIHNRILVIKPSQPTEMLFSNNKDHLERLAYIIKQSHHSHHSHPSK